MFCAAWVGIRGLAAKAELEAAQALVSQIKAEALDFDIAAATATLADIDTHTNNAVSLTSDPVWRIVELTPWLGSNLTAVRELSSVVRNVIADVVQPLVGVADNINPATLAPKDGGIDLTPLVDALPAVAEAHSGTLDALKSLNAISTEGTISQVVAAKSKVVGLLGDIQPAIEALNSVLPLLPPALGSETPRTYVVMFQNNAELRALGGTALSFAVVQVDQGKIKLSQTIPAGFGNFTKYTESVLAMPDGATTLYPYYGTYIPNVTLRPSFESAAELTNEMWIREFGYAPDGIVSIDPIALSYVLRATEPITLSSGDVLNDKTLVPLLLNGIYQRFNTGDAVEDNRMQDAVYGEAVNATFARLTNGPLKPKPLVAAMLQGLKEHRILIWSAHENEQAELRKAGMEVGLPKSDEGTERLGLYLQDNVGSKLNFYLTQKVRLEQAKCSADGRQSYRISTELTSTLAVGVADTLSVSIIGQWAREGLLPGDQRLIVMLYAPPGSTIVGTSINGVPIPVEPFHDESYPVGKVLINIPPGTVGTVSFDILAPEPSDKKLEVLTTPMVNPTTIATEELDCATVPLR